MSGGADLSDCGRYRYRLWRDGWDEEDDRACLFVMCNPSTANAVDDDATIRRCVGFCSRWGYGRLFVVNLFAFRSTDPRGLLTAADPVGPDNDVWIAAELKAASRVVLAWGSPSQPALRRLIAARVRQIMSFADFPPNTGRLGSCKDGSPRHPVRLPYESPFFTSRFLVSRPG
jgi:hypothetical protein